MFIPIRDENNLHIVPYVTYGLMAVNVVIWLITDGTMLGGLDPEISQQWGSVPERGSLLTMFTSQFLHSGILHLAGSMLFLWIFGDDIEDRVGRLGFLRIYLGTGVAANMVHGLFVSEADLHRPCVGASGAISGIMGALLLQSTRILPHGLARGSARRFGRPLRCSWDAQERYADGPTPLRSW